MTVATAWDRFFHAEVDPRVAAGFRIAFGLLVTVDAAVYLAHFELFFSEAGPFPQHVAAELAGSPAPSLFFLLPAGDAFVRAGLVLYLAQALGLLLGVAARVQAAGVFVWLVSIHNRSPLIGDSEDAVLRLFAFFAVFLPLSRVWSVDARRRGRREAADGGAIWPLRLIQIQTCVAVFASGLEKLRGSDWLEGVALYYVARVDDLFGRVPVPALLFESMPLVRALTWSVMLLELALPLLVWLPRWRRAVVALAVLFHLGIELTMNLFLFQWLMILGWLTFLTPEDWSRLARRPRAGVTAVS